MSVLALILYIVAAAAFLIAAIDVHRRSDGVPVGLFFLTAAIVVQDTVHHVGWVR